MINGFESILLKKGFTVRLYEGIYFEDFVDLIFFDMKLKKYTLFKIFDIESRLRTSIAYNFASVYCQNATDTMNYTNRGYYQAPSPADTHMSNIFRSFDLFRPTLYWPDGSIKKKSFIDALKEDKDYVNQYTNPPFGVVIKSLPLGSLYYTFIFLNNVVKEKVLKDFGLELNDVDALEQALFILKEVRNQCAQLELITRFRLKRKTSLNNFQEITVMAGLSHGRLNYLDVMKIFKIFGKTYDIKRVIAFVYYKITFKGRKKIADKALAMMRRKKLRIWLNADRVEVERSFSLAKRCYGLGRIMTKLDVTTRSSIALSILMMNVARIAARSLCQFLLAIFSRYFGQDFLSIYKQKCRGDLLVA